MNNLSRGGETEQQSRCTETVCATAPSTQCTQQRASFSQTRCECAPDCLRTSSCRVTQSDILRAAFNQQLTAFCLFLSHFRSPADSANPHRNYVYLNASTALRAGVADDFLVDVSVRNAQSVQRSPRSCCCTQCTSNRCECIGTTRIDTRARHVRTNPARMFLYAVRRVTRARNEKNFAQRRAQGLDDFESETKY